MTQSSNGHDDIVRPLLLRATTVTDIRDITQVTKGHNRRAAQLVSPRSQKVRMTNINICLHRVLRIPVATDC
jgi:hypothetical protein